MVRWVDTNWRFEDLHGKRVRFELNRGDGTRTGMGRFQVFKRSDQKMSILVQAADPEFDVKLHFVLDQEAVNSIQRAQNAEVEFACRC